MKTSTAKANNNFVNLDNIKLTIEKTSFLRSLARLQSIVERRNTIPVLSNIKIDAKSGILNLTATDMDISASENISAQVDQEGSVTVPAHTTYDIIRKLPDGAQIELTLDSSKDTQLQLKSGKSKFKLPCLPASEFPEISEGQMQHNFTLPAKDLLALIDKTKFAISTEETRYYLNGIYFHVVEAKGKQVLRAVATDGHRLAKIEITVPNGATGMPGVIIPRKTVNELKKMLESNPAAEVKIAVSKTKVKFSTEETTIISKLIDGTFPDYEKVIPKDNNKIMEVDARSLNQAVDRVSTIAIENKAIKFSVSNGNLNLTANSAESGNAVEDIAVTYSAEPVEIGFNFRYVLEMLTELDGETAQFQISDGSSPVLVRDPSDVTTLYVIMPMRV